MVGVEGRYRNYLLYQNSDYVGVSQWEGVINKLDG